MRVLYFGTYSKGGGYPRNTVIIESLRRAGVEVEECHVPLFADAHAKVAAATKGLPLVRTLRSWMRLTRRFRRAGAHDLVVVGYTGHFDIHLARMLARGRPVVLDAFLSPWDTVVHDRRLLGEGSLRARALFLAEKWALHRADFVLTDTDAHAEFMARTFGVPRERFHPVPVGSLIRVPVPVGGGGAAPGARLRAFFCGSFVPLQGVPVILDAAARAPEVDFRIVGDGPGAAAIEEEVRARGMPNVHLERRFIPREELAAGLEEADVVLGVFGESEKAGRVVPCKVYDGLAAGRPVVTGDGPAARSLLTHGENVYLVPRGDAAALAAALRELSDPSLRATLSAGARRAFRERFTTEAIGARLRAALEAIA
jgi:glycosyltransferase involved in cell wall biosynthesis